MAVRCAPEDPEAGEMGAGRECNLYGYSLAGLMKVD